MQLAFDSDVEEFRAEFSAFLDEHTPSAADTLERPRSVSHMPQWARDFQRLLFENQVEDALTGTDHGDRHAHQRDVPRAFGIGTQTLAVCDLHAGEGHLGHVQDRVEDIDTA